MSDLVRCRWAVEHPELIDYHDNAWGRPTHDDRAIMAAYGQCIMHAGLNWTAMLRKRADFAAAFDEGSAGIIQGSHTARLQIRRIRHRHRLDGRHRHGQRARRGVFCTAGVTKNNAVVLL